MQITGWAAALSNEARRRGKICEIRRHFVVRRRPPRFSGTGQFDHGDRLLRDVPLSCRRPMRRRADAAQAAPRQLRLWPAVVMLALFWAYRSGQRHARDVDVGTRFMSRLAVHALLLLGFLGGGCRAARSSWRERLLALAVFVVGSVGGAAVADPSISVMAIFLAALPIVFTAGTIWLLLCKCEVLSPATRRVGVRRRFLLVLGRLHAHPLRRAGWRAARRIQLAVESDVGAVVPGESHGRAADRGRRSLPHGRCSRATCPAFAAPIATASSAARSSTLDWAAHAPQKIWRQRLGPAWSSLIVVDGHVVTQEQRDESEVVACYDAATGKEIWAHADPVRFYEGLSGAGPRGTPTFADGRIYALGGKGNLNCLDAATGKLALVARSRGRSRARPCRSGDSPCRRWWSTAR